MMSVFVYTNNVPHCAAHSQCVRVHQDSMSVLLAERQKWSSHDYSTYKKKVSVPSAGLYLLLSVYHLTPCLDFLPYASSCFL